MKTEEVINWLFDIWHEWENIYGSTAEINLIEGKKYDGVIELLQRGEENEKYKWAWKDVAKKFAHVTDEQGENIKIIFEVYEQKYFPKA